MSTLEQVYRRSPIAAQNLMATAFGVKERAIRYGGAYQRFCLELEDAQWQTPEQIAETRDRRLRAMVGFCVEQVPYYRSLFTRLDAHASDIGGAADLALLPILDKETVRANPEDFVPDNLGTRLIPQTTGGTTGTPLRYFVTAEAQQYNYATYEVRFRRWAGTRFGARMASINGRKIVPIEQGAPPYWRHNLAFNQLYLSAYHMTEDNLPLYVRRLERFEPDVIVGYVSSIHLLAEHINRNGMSGTIAPRAVMVSSETLFPWIRSEIEKAFGCRVHDGYGLGELVAFASECPAGRIHESPEYGVIEACSVGGETHLVGTGLFNRAMPLLRYDTGDIVELGDRGAGCPCGRGLPTIERIVGRSDDHVRTPDGRVVGAAPLSLAFQGVPGVRESQIVQDDLAAITVLLVVTDDYTPADQAFLESELRQRLGTVLDIKIRVVDEIERTVWGKRRIVVSTLGGDR